MVSFAYEKYDSIGMSVVFSLQHTQLWQSWKPHVAMNFTGDPKHH